jgi:rhodanese-related sulfurtransferase
MKFLLDNLLWIGLIVLSGGALLLPELRKASNRVSTLQATQMMNQTGKTVVVDVRDKEAYGSGHLPDARHVPLAELAQRQGELEKFKTRNVIVVCQSGTQSGRASAILAKAGFAQVFSLDGGVAGWQAQGLPTVRST